MHLSVAIDLGTTVIKAGIMTDDGTLDRIISAEAPPVRGEGLIRESDAEEYFQTADRLLSEITSGLPEDIPIGLASQRSSFLIWDAESLKPATKLISWGDRRSEEWCRLHSDIDMSHLKRTGLLMSPHYPASKIALIMNQSPELMDRACKMMFGQIDTYCMWRWCGSHIVDMSMAARTLLIEEGEPSWSEYMLDFFGVPESILPEIRPSYGRNDYACGYGVITASLSDQASAMNLFKTGADEFILINIGTGAFVLASTGMASRSADGLLTGPALMSPEGLVTYTLEGTVNGLTDALRAYNIEAVEFPAEDSLHEYFCIPDTSGIGAPFWDALSTQKWSRPCSVLNETERCRIVLEGIIFRIVHIIKLMCPEGDLPKLYISGGLSNSAFIRSGLASCINNDILWPEESEATLLNAARLAAGDVGFKPPDCRTVTPSSDASYLRSKYAKWLDWALLRA